jgi:tryptophanyl-tRNA synthetase
MAKNSKKINETLSKSDVSKEIKVYMDSNDFKKKIEKIVKDRLKNEKELEDKIVDITKNVITQLYKALWVKRGLWRDSLSNKAN